MVESARTAQLPASSTPTIWDRLAQALSPIEERPRIAHTIESAHHRARDGSRYVVIHNTTAHTYLRLEPTEFEMLPLMDGTRSVKALVVGCYQRNEEGW